MLRAWMDRIPTWVKVTAVLVLCAVLWQQRPWRLHKEVAARNVERVELWPKGAQQGLPATPEEARQVIAWFNAGTNIKDNWHHAGPGCGIFSEVKLYLRSGERIDVTSYMRVYRGDKDYYFQQPELQAFIKSLDQREATGNAAPGC